MIGGVQQKILVHQDENGNLKMDDEMGKLLFGDPIIVIVIVLAALGQLTVLVPITE
jgi:hypothetical protein